MKQTTFASAAWEKKGKVTRRERFLAEMDQVIPWSSILSLIEPHYPKAGNGTQPMPMERMLRIYFMQQWFNLSDPAMEDALYDSESMRRFAGVELIDDAVPDESTILRFRHLLERHQLTQRLFELVRGLLEQKRLLLKSGTIVDATIIDAPPSTKNESKSRDPEMKQGKKNGREWHFGMKAHVGTDLNGLVHTVVTTHAGASDFSQLPKLLHGQERELYGDQAYWSELHRIAAKKHGVRYRVNRRPNPGRPLTEHQRKLNRLRSATRARGEHAFNVVKRLWGFSKVRYRGLAKNTARLFTAFAMANLYMVRRQLMPPQEACRC
ncbi:MAG TPA: IS5 family transposase [Steroidobacteraceae bacterium]|jgi:IS5 family transposase|nr:IS5 family transposase [Steroidobacteraceae bacterium]